MQNILEKLKENLQVIYRKGLDADHALEQLQKTGKGKHQSVFADDAGFNASSKRFAPYIQELADDIQQLEKAADDIDKQALASVVKKIELLLVTLASFNQAVKK